MSEKSKVTTPPPAAINTGARQSVNQPAKRVEVVKQAAEPEVQVAAKEPEAVPAPPPPPAINRGVAPAAPAAKAAVIAQRQAATPNKSEALTAAPGSRTATLLSNLKRTEPSSVNPTELVADLLKDVPKAYCYPIIRVCDYIVRMNPRKAENREQGAVEQAALYHSITNIINNQEAHFTPLFTALLRLFNEYNGPRDVFHDFNSSRFMEIVSLNADDRKAFNNLVCFLKVFAEPKTRDTVKRTTDHARLLAYGLTEAGRNRVMTFLGL